MSAERYEKFKINAKSSDCDNQNFIDNFQKFKIPNEIQNLLWFADGPYKNLDPDNRKKNIITIPLLDAEIKVELNPRPEPSAIFANLPINFQTKKSPIENFQPLPPKYYSLNSDERYLYLNWLRNIEENVNISYVFLFYFGLERHLILGNYKEAVNILINLRKYHQHNQFIRYSNGAIVYAALLHKDDTTLIRLLDSIQYLKYPQSVIGQSWILYAKYKMQLDLTPDEIIYFCSDVGIKRNNYIKNYYPLFKEYLIKALLKQFKKPTFPFYNLEMSIPEIQELVFANHTIPGVDNYISTPSIKDSPQFKQALYTILLEVSDSVKQIPSNTKKEYMRKLSVTSDETQGK